MNKPVPIIAVASIVACLVLAAFVFRKSPGEPPVGAADAAELQSHPEPANEGASSAEAKSPLPGAGSPETATADKPYALTLKESDLKLSPEQRAQLEQFPPEKRTAKLLEWCGPQILELMMKLPPEIREDALRAMNGQDVEGEQNTLE